MSQPKRSPGEIFAAKLENAEKARLKPYALKCSERKKRVHFREHEVKTPLEYRTEYIRDRDRIVWSRTFKRLQHKTQIFPHYTPDHYRRRLTHTLEVSQIATTIARALGLNENATESISFGHDLGHAPFGHGGERALNAILIDLKNETENDYEESENLPIFSFNHAVHGIETVERIEKEYKSNYVGLNLTFDVREGILKHTPPIAKEIDKYTAFREYSKYEANCGSLEAQCVYLSDKIAFFFADFEDALRSQILDCKDLRGILFERFQKQLSESIKKFRKKLAPIKTLTKKIYNIDDFFEFRRDGIAAFILNTIINSDRAIQRKKTKTVDEAKRERFISMSKPLEDAKVEVYNQLIENKVFKHEIYQVTEHKAKKIVKDLFEAYLSNFNLISRDFKEQMDKAYKELIPDKRSRKIVMVKNYIAGMTDSYAIARHRDLFMSSENIPIS